MISPSFDPPDLVPAANLSINQRLEAAALVRLANPILYATLAPETADDLIAQGFCSNGSELAATLVSVASERATGIVCAYPSAEKAERQYEGYQFMARSLDRASFVSFTAGLRDLRAGLPEFDDEGFFLALIAAHPSQWGTGLSYALLHQTIEMAGEHPLFLTVDRKNLRARAFYEKHGFKCVREGSRFQLLRHN